VTGQLVPGPSPKYKCPSCEDFGLIVGEDGLGTTLCTEEGCAAAARLRADPAATAIAVDDSPRDASGQEPAQ
jgi:hypothetical protein